MILTAWQWLMCFTCIPVQNEPNESPLRKRFLALLLLEIGHLSSPSRSGLGRLILIHGGRGWGGGPCGWSIPPQHAVWSLPCWFWRSRERQSPLYISQGVCQGHLKQWLGRTSIDKIAGHISWRRGLCVWKGNPLWWSLSPPQVAFVINRSSQLVCDCEVPIRSAWGGI